MSDLVAFLTARLHEDDAGSLKLHERKDGNVPLQHAFAARMLREVEAKRKILALHHPDLWNADDDPDITHCAECTTDDDLYKPQMYPCQTVRLLAAVYDGHPDYDAAWAPDSP